MASSAGEPIGKVIGLELEAQPRGNEVKIKTGVAEMRNAFAKFTQGVRTAAKRHGHFHALAEVKSLEAGLRRELRLSVAKIPDYAAKIAS